MIKFDSVSKNYKKIKEGDNTPIRDISFELTNGSNLSVLTRSPYELKTFLKLLTGAELPTTGEITRRASISPVLNSIPAFSPKMTGEENIRFLCKIYGKKPSEVISFVRDFAEIDKQLKLKVSDTSIIVLKKIAYASIIALDFDIYLVNKEINAGGHKDFKVKCQQKFQEISKRKTIIMIPASMKMAKKFTDSALILTDGTAQYFEDLEEGLSHYKESANIE